MGKFLFFDTNAFYNYVGREKITTNESFCSALKYNKSLFIKLCKNEIRSICSCCVMEMITKFRKDQSAIKNIINLIDENNFFISTVGPNYDIKKVLKQIKEAIESNNIAVFNKLMDEMCYKKSEMESTWIFTFSAEISLCYVKFISESLNDKTYSERLIDFYSSYTINKIEDKVKEITEALFNAYKIDQEKRTAKDIFYDTVWEYCLVAKSFYEHCKLLSEGKNINEINVDELRKEIELTIPSSTERDKKEIAKIIIKEFKSNSNRYDFILTHLISEFNKDDKMSEFQSSYIRHILDKLFKVNSSEQSQELRKNDIIDMIILGSISPKMIASMRNNGLSITSFDLYLVTFDGDLLKHLKEQKIDNYNFIKLFYEN